MQLPTWTKIIIEQSEQLAMGNGGESQLGVLEYMLDPKGKVQNGVQLFIPYVFIP